MISDEEIERLEKELNGPVPLDGSTRYVDVPTLSIVKLLAEVKILRRIIKDDYPDQAAMFKHWRKMVGIE